VLDAAAALATGPADALIRDVLARSGYLELLDGLPEHERDERRANVEELVAGAEAFGQANPDPSLASYLAETALLTDLDRVDGGEGDRTLLLTMHNAKGLEFPVVIVAGLEEGLLPHASALEDPDELEEERRLFYVALTRARDEVLLTAAAFRRRWDGMGGGQVSRFIDEIPEDLLERETPPSPAWSRSGANAYGDDDAPRWGSAARRGGSTRSARSSGSPGGTGTTEAPAFRTKGPLAHLVGREVHHEVFGRGVVVAAEGEGGDVKFVVRFGSQMKKVLGRFLTGGFDGDHA